MPGIPPACFLHSKSQPELVADDFKTFADVFKKIADDFKKIADDLYIVRRLVSNKMDILKCWLRRNWLVIHRCQKKGPPGRSGTSPGSPG